MKKAKNFKQSETLFFYCHVDTVSGCRDVGGGGIPIVQVFSQTINRYRGINDIVLFVCCTTSLLLYHQGALRELILMCY